MCCIYMLPNPTPNLFVLYPPNVDQTAPLSKTTRKKNWSFCPTEARGHLQFTQ